MKSIVSSLVVVLVLSWAGVAASEEFLETTVETLHADPWAYHGKRVRLRGTFDECTSLTCVFCDDNPDQQSLGKRPAACTHVSFAVRDVGTNLGMDEHGRDVLRQQLSDTTDYLARFTTSTIEATYSAECSGIAARGSDPNVVIVCTDRASELESAKIVETHISRPATKGFISFYGGAPVSAAAEEEASRIRAAFDAAISDPENRATSEDFVFVSSPSEGGLCRCLLETCVAADWPTLEGHVWIRTPANPYKCWTAERIGERWRFPID